MQARAHALRSSTRSAARLDEAAAVALATLREPHTGLAAILGALSETSGAIVVGAYAVPADRSEVRLLGVAGIDPVRVATFRHVDEATCALVRAIAAAPAAGFAERPGVDGPWGRFERTWSWSFVLPEGVSVLLAGTGAHFNDASIEKVSPVVALLSSATMMRDTVASLRRQMHDLRQERVLLTAGLQHDLRTPLTGVMGAAGLLRDRVGEMSTAEVEEVLDMINRQSERMRAMITDSLAASEDPDAPIRPRVFDLMPLIRLVQQVALTARNGDVSVDGPRIVMFSDSGRVERIVLNLLDNALRFAPAGTPVRVVCEERAGTVTITVADEGPGVDPALVKTLFTPYVTGGGADGTGLGLYSSARLAAALGGHLAYSRLEGWTRFTLTLPNTNVNTEKEGT